MRTRKPAAAPALPEQGPALFFTSDHRACDARWEEVETAADGGDAQATARALIGFDAAVRRHLALEEEILFPALEDASGMHGVGPTQVMRMEHAQMRGLLDAMARAAAGGDVDGVTDHGDTLMMLIGQHNLKEEGMLYPMAEDLLGGPRWSDLARRVRAAIEQPFS